MFTQESMEEFRNVYEFRNTFGHITNKRGYCESLNHMLKDAIDTGRMIKEGDVEEIEATKFTIAYLKSEREKMYSHPICDDNNLCIRFFDLMVDYATNLLPKAA